MNHDHQEKPLVDWPPLAQLRRSRKISVKRIAAATKIKPHYLKAIEKGELDKLPSGVYSTNYVRQYARAIRFDEEDLVARFRTLTAPADSTAADTQPKAALAPVSGRSRLFGWLRRNAREDSPQAKWQQVLAVLRQTQS